VEGCFQKMEVVMVLTVIFPSQGTSAEAETLCTGGTYPVGCA